MPLFHDELFEFNGLNAVPSRCRVRVFTPPDEAKESGYVILWTDDRDAEGTSVTNAAERLAVLVCTRHHIPRDRAQFVEHYDFRHWSQGHDGSGHEQLFAVVTFAVPTEAGANFDYIHGTSWGRPMWRHIDRQSVEILIGEPLP